MANNRISKAILVLVTIITGGMLFLQPAPKQCGLACLSELLRCLGKPSQYEVLLRDSDRKGDLVDFHQLKDLAFKRGVVLNGFELRSVNDISLYSPCIVRLRSQHFVLVSGLKSDGTLAVYDPDFGNVEWTVQYLGEQWSAMVLSPTK